MTNRLEIALEQTGNVFMEMAKEIRSLKEEIAEMQVLVHKHETINDYMGKVYSGAIYRERIDMERK